MQLPNERRKEENVKTARENNPKYERQHFGVSDFCESKARERKSDERNTGIMSKKKSTTPAMTYIWETKSNRTGNEGFRSVGILVGFIDSRKHEHVVIPIRITST